MEQNLKYEFSHYSDNELKEIYINRIHRGYIITAARKELEKRGIKLTIRELNQMESVKKLRIEGSIKKEKTLKEYFVEYITLVSDKKKVIHLSLLGSILSLIGIIIVVNEIENGDTNAIGMYVIVFLQPMLIISFINAIILLIALKFKNIFIKRLISFSPIILLSILVLFKDLRISLIDGSLYFLFLLSLITIGITNFIWNILITIQNKSIRKITMPNKQYSQ